MKKRLLTLLLLTIFFPGWSQKTIVTKVSKIAEKSRIQTLTLFHQDQTKARMTAGDTLPKLVINTSAFNAINRDKPQFLSLSLLRNDGSDLIIDLIADDIHAARFRVEDAAGRKVPSPAGVYYRGIIRGNKNSLVSLNFNATDVGGFISDETGNYELLRMQDLYALVPASEIESAILCDVKDEIIQISAEQVKAVRTDDFVNCRAVEIYFEADHTLFSAFGSIDATAEYVNRLFVQVATLFENEGIEIKISRLKVWDQPDPYESGRSNSMDMLSQFASRMEKTDFDGDLAHLLTKSGIGGRAHINVLCFPSAFGKTGVTGSLIDDILPVPLFSRDVQILAHELGHNFGSPHTQSCFWPAGPIDNCVPPEGNCPPTGLPPQNGGTIMSYCGHINLAHGFGELPGNLIRNYAVLCFGGKSEVENLKVEEVSATQAYLSWKTPQKYQNLFEVEYKEASASEWLNAEANNPQIKLTGLKPATRYQWRVKTSCADFAESAFITSEEAGYCNSEILYTNCYGYAHADAVLLNHNLMNNPAFCADKGYTFHFDRRQSLAIGKTHSFEIRISQEQNYLTAALWIDFNNNKIFEENEKIFSSPESFQNVLKGNFYINSNVMPVSKVRMRIVLSASNPPEDPCGRIFLGEVQDYYVDLITCREASKLPDHVGVENITASKADLSWDNPDQTELLVEYREKGSEFWNGYWTTKPGIQLNVIPNARIEWRVSRPCSDYITGEFTTPKDEYCEVSYQYPFDCAAQYGMERFTIPDLNFTLNTSCSSTGNTYHAANPLKLVAGTAYTFSLNFKKSAYPPYLHATIWIDLDGNGRFEDSERVYMSDLPFPEGQSGVFTIPAYLSQISDTRMRIRIGNSSPTLACLESYAGHSVDIAAEIVENCAGYSVTNIEANHPTACTEGDISIFFNHGEGRPVAICYSKDGIRDTLRSTISNGRVIMREMAGGDYTIASYIIGTCTIPLNGTVNLNKPLPLKPVASNTGPYLEGDTIRLSVDSGQYFHWEGPGNFYTREQSPFIADASLLHSGMYRVVVTDADNCYSEAFTTVVVDRILAGEPYPENIRIKVYPNPALNYFTIEVPFEGESSGVMADAQGREVKTFHFNREVIIFTDKIGPGLYTVKIKNGRQEASAKIILH